VTALVGVVLALVLFKVLFFGPAKVTGETPAERIACICRLADDQPFGAADAIAAAAAHDPDAAVRRAAVLCLGKFHHMSDWQLVEACTHDSAPSVREAAAMTLARYADTGAVDRLAQMVSDDGSEAVRLGALAALDLQASPAALVALLEIMEGSPETSSQVRACELLEKKFGIPVKPDPGDSTRWNHLVEMLKCFDEVQDAYRQVGKPLERHPEHLILDYRYH